MTFCSTFPKMKQENQVSTLQLITNCVKETIQSIPNTTRASRQSRMVVKMAAVLLGSVTSAANACVAAANKDILKKKADKTKKKVACHCVLQVELALYLYRRQVMR